MWNYKDADLYLENRISQEWTAHENISGRSWSFAQKVGYEYAEYRIEWKGYSCYELCFTGMDDMKIGWPQYVLVDRKGKMRLAKDEKREMK